MKHDLKIWPQYFQRVKDGSKTFEVRKNDRGYQPGDEVVLREYDPQQEDPGTGYGGDIGTSGYTGKILKFKIGYVLPIDAERVVFSLLPINPAPSEGSDR